MMSVVDGEESRVDFAGIDALLSRSAGYSVAAECLRVQSAAEALDPSLRTANKVTLAPEAWSWYTGAIGEIAVGKMLTALGPEWFVRHAVPIGAGTKDVDHLVIGPGGVFAINTKHHAGASIWIGDHVIKVNRSNTGHLRGAIRDSGDVARRLAAKTGFAVPATPVLAMFDPGSIKDGRVDVARPVAVLDARQLVVWLLNRPRQFSETELSLIRFAAEEPETWHVDPRAADTLRVMHRFDRLSRLVGTPAKPVTQRSPGTAAPSPSRRPVRATSRRTRNSSTSGRSRGRSTKRSTAATFGDLLKLWVAIGFILAAIAAATAFINQPCASPTACALFPLYQALAPVLGLASLAAIGVGALATLLWLVRRITR
jgi:hypothetical protein